MPLNFDSQRILTRLRGVVAPGPGRRDPRLVWKRLVGLLLAANLAAFFLLVRPIGGTTEELTARLEQSRRDLRARQAAIARLRSLLQKVEDARSGQESFMKQYFMDRRSASSTILVEIGNAASQAGLKPKEHSFVIEPIEGAASLALMTITANYEGTYADLVQFVNRIDRSQRFLIIDSIQAAPMQTPGTLASRFKIHTFVRENEPGPGIPAPDATPAAKPSTVPVAQLREGRP